MQIMAYSLATWLLAMVGVPDRSRKFLDRAVSLEKQAGDTARGWLGVAWVYYGKYIASDNVLTLTASRLARELFTRVGDVRFTVLTQILEGVALTELGMHEESLVPLDEALATCDASTSPLRAATRSAGRRTRSNRSADSTRRSSCRSRPTARSTTSSPTAARRSRARRRSCSRRDK